MPPLRRLVLSGAVMGLTFLLWNPAWWSLDYAVPYYTVDYRTSLLKAHSRDARVYGLAYESQLDRARGLANSLFWDGPQFAENPQWVVWLAGDIDRYESSGLAGRLGGPVWAVLGYGALAAGLVRAWRSRRAVEVQMVLAWGAVVAVALYVLTPMAWQRYYLPLQAPAAVFAGLGAAALLNAAGLVSGAVRRATTRQKTGDAHG